jgi:predicted dinucleotide-binding enzyme
MKIGIVGSGEMGKTLGQLWMLKGHNVLFGSRDPERVTEWIKTNDVKARSGTYNEASNYGKIVLLATNWSDTKNALEAVNSLVDKILIDCTNPEIKDGLVVGFDTSGAEEIAKIAKGAKIVKAFNHIYGSMLKKGTRFGKDNASIFYCGDDLNSKEIVAQLAREIGLEPIDAGELKSARYLEPLAALWVKLAGDMKWGGANIALKFLQR